MCSFWKCVKNGEYLCSWAQDDGINYAEKIETVFAYYYAGIIFQPQFGV